MLASLGRVHFTFTVSKHQSLTELTYRTNNEFLKLVWAIGCFLLSQVHAFQNTNIGLDTGRLYVQGFQGEQEEDVVEVTQFRHARATGVSCGFDITVFAVEDKLYTTSHVLNTISEVSNVDMRSFKYLTCHLTSKVYAVSYDNVLSTSTRKSKFAREDTPILEQGDTIISIITGYNFTVMVVGKKRTSRLNQYWKFDDVDIIAHIM